MITSIIITIMTMTMKSMTTTITTMTMRSMITTIMTMTTRSMITMITNIMSITTMSTATAAAATIIMTMRAIITQMMYLPAGAPRPHHKYTDDKVQEVLERMANSQEFGMVLRAKGMIQATDGTSIYFDLVPGEYEIRKGEPEVTGRLCVIGTGLKTEEIERAFRLK